MSSPAKTPVGPLSGTDLVRWTINQITTNPKEWDQRFWHCGSVHCFFGWADIAYSGARTTQGFKGPFIGGLRVNEADLEVAMGLPRGSSRWLSEQERTLGDLWVFCREFLAGRLASNWGEETKQNVLRAIAETAADTKLTLL